MPITMILATDKNGLIGLDGKLPWHNKADLKFFSEITKGEGVVMGRKTFDSLPDQYRPLPDRKNFVLTRNFSTDDDNDLRNHFRCVSQGTPYDNNYKEHFEVSYSFVMSLSKAYKNLFIIGGKEIFELFLKDDLIDYVIHSEIDEKIEVPEGSEPVYFDIKQIDRGNFIQLGDIWGKLPDGPRVSMYKKFVEDPIVSKVENILNDMTRKDPCENGACEI